MDDTNTTFFSGWDIDQVLVSDQITITLPLNSPTPTLLVDFSRFNLSYVPRAQITWRTTGETRWNMESASSGMTANTFSNPITPAMTTTSLSVFGGNGVSYDIRYVVFKNSTTP